MRLARDARERTAWEGKMGGGEEEARRRERVTDLEMMYVATIFAGDLESSSSLRILIPGKELR